MGLKKVVSTNDEPLLGSGESRVDELVDCLATMKLQEMNSLYKCCDYLSRRQKAKIKSSSNATAESRLERTYREKICEWMYRVVDHFRVNRDVVSISLSYLDRYLAVTGEGCDTKVFRLASVAALYIACKLFDSMGPLKAPTLVELSRKEFEVRDIEMMEIEMLHTLQWRVNPPTSSTFVRYIFAVVSQDKSMSLYSKLVDDSLYFTDLAVCDYFFVSQKPSVVAMASIKNAIIKCCNFCGLQESEGLSLLRSIAIDCGVEHDSRIVKVAQERLWEIYSDSDEYKELASAHVMSPSQNICDVSSVKINPSRPYGSPVSVSRFVGS
eukprot:CAMPEP_0171293818 /NCGR_PEP_ID=MMETSP0816-20121228/2171_1 /TAXON_ID=420281 /ORGANISM="Proboscia inermis, Strain CCAP1064/1" /LENGTH=324 /DNA_ID=CAMNT_0011765077 /DNA_START=80 /DNA_END=1054 /DNA_ORIENTATION=-